MVSRWARHYGVADSNGMASLKIVFSMGEHADVVDNHTGSFVYEGEQDGIYRARFILALYALHNSVLFGSKPRPIDGDFHTWFEFLEHEFLKKKNIYVSKNLDLGLGLCIFEEKCFIMLESHPALGMYVTPFKNPDRLGNKFYANRWIRYSDIVRIHKDDLPAQVLPIKKKKKEIQPILKTNYGPPIVVWFEGSWYLLFDIGPDGFILFRKTYTPLNISLNEGLFPVQLVALGFMGGYFLEISADGSAAAGKAGWGFVVIGFDVSVRFCFGPVVLDARNRHYIGARVASDNSGEASALYFAFKWLSVTGFSGNVVISYDSELAVALVRDPGSSSHLSDISNRTRLLWDSLKPLINVSFLKIKGHSGDFANDAADLAADRGREGLFAFDTHPSRLLDDPIDLLGNYVTG